MCELFGFSAGTPIKITEALKEFYHHSEKHPHGWGIAVRERDMMNIDKEPVCAQKSIYLKHRLREGIESRLVLAHIRLATIGNMEYNNCHPFMNFDDSGVQWTLIHNGTIFDFPPLRKYLFLEKGETDSERILLYLIERMNDKIREKGRKLSEQEKFQVIERMIEKMSKGNKLNLIITDGKHMYIHTNFKNSLYYSLEVGSAYVTTNPDFHRKETWRVVPFCRLLMIHNGEVKEKGSLETHEYIETPEQLKYLYQAFAGL